MKKKTRTRGIRVFGMGGVWRNRINIEGKIGHTKDCEKLLR
jgi:hypothetical protein